MQVLSLSLLSLPVYGKIHLPPTLPANSLQHLLTVLKAQLAKIKKDGGVEGMAELRELNIGEGSEEGVRGEIVR